MQSRVNKSAGDVVVLLMVHGKPNVEYSKINQ
jgi:hypothetical protein